MLKRAAHSAFFLDIWNVGVLNRPIASLLTQPTISDVVWFPEPGGTRFLADPFAYEERGDLFVLAEAYDYRSGRADIVEFRAAEPALRRPAIQRTEHLSYPFVFTHADRYYCMPECAESGGLPLYRRDDQAWVFERWLLRGIRAVDASLIAYQGRWWLWATHADDLPDARLYLYYADSLEGPWQPHARNPIKEHLSGSRPAGTPFLFDGGLYRPAQDCSITYGGSVVIHRVTEMTPDRYSEDVVTQVHPNPAGNYPVGIHTLSAVGDKVVVDGRRRKFVTLAALPKLQMVWGGYRRRRKLAQSV